MPVTDHQMATLRAQLTGRIDEHRRLLSQMDNAMANQYLSLATAAFFEAAMRRFVRDGSPVDDAEIIEFVTSVRLRLGDPDDLDPQAAETLIKIAIEKLPVEAKNGISPELSNSTKIILLSGMVGDLDPTPDQLEEFLNAARAMTDKAFS
ncbi:hypothetical protein [Actinomadura mexicana]|uniref:Uncharacterized protein n=1 Tax=Actinomadura mexicana TaxID=134959 RepID=A0A239D0G6_9ACTN|nr:hypothetical protein [Actinomadura mexicana]SNS25294.1 hypothetical protein SAMN06265355_113193 [Actinomadura mexicana]